MTFKNLTFEISFNSIYANYLDIFGVGDINSKDYDKVKAFVDNQFDRMKTILLENGFEVESKNIFVNNKIIKTEIKDKIICYYNNAEVSQNEAERVLYLFILDIIGRLEVSFAINNPNN